MLNAIGLANPGRARFLDDHLPRLRELGLPLWISVGGFCAADYADTCEALDDVAAIELNLSCPNVDEAADGAAEIVAACRAATPLPLYAKLSAAHPDVAAVARAVADAGADGLSLINTLRGAALDPRTLRPVLARTTGGLSGPSLKPVALAAVHACYAATGSADRRHGRRHHRTGRPGADRVRRARRCARHDSVLGSRRSRTAFERSLPRRRRAPVLPVLTTFTVARTSREKARTRGEKSPLDRRGSVVMIGRPTWPPPNFKHTHPSAHSTSGWTRSNGPTTSGCAGRS